MVKVLSRDAVQRMTGRRSSSAVNIGGGSGYASGVSASWVDANYISKDFFSQLFTIHGTRTYIDEETEEEVTEEVVITPNSIPDGEEYKLSNIEVSIGLWTQQFLSALGLNSSGGGGGGSSTLAGLDDVQLGTLVNGQALVYNSSTGKWVNGTVIPDLSSYATKTWVQQQGYLTQHQSLAGYATESWVTSKGYATETWVTGRGYITASALTGYATEMWVQQQGYLTAETHLGTVTRVNTGTGLTGGPIVSSGTISISSTYQTYIAHGQTAYGWGDHSAAGYLKRHQSVDGTFWGQSWSNHGSVSGDMTGVGHITTSGNIKMGGQYYLMGVSGTNGAMIESTSSTVTIGLHSGNGIEWDTRTGSGYMLQAKYDVDNVVSKKYVQIWDAIRLGDAMLIWDATNNAIKVIKADGSAANFYATGGISALGYSS